MDTEENIREPICNVLLRKHPEWFENIQKNGVETVSTKKIFRITNPFIPIIEDDGTDNTYMLPVHYLDHGNFNGIQCPCKYVGIKFSTDKKEQEKYKRSLDKVTDICSNIYNDNEDASTDPDMERTIGTVWEERKDRYYPIVTDEGNNLMIDVNIEDPKIKDLMNYKLKLIDSLKKEALKMNKPEKVGVFQYKFLGNIDRKVAYDIAIERQDYTCIGCGYRPNNIDKFIDTYDEEEGRKLEPHRIVHNCFLGDYDRDNVVILCTKCHSLEYKYFRVHWNRFFENGKLLEWNKLIDESFEFFKEYLIWLHLRK